MKNDKKNIGCAATAFRTWVASLKNYAANRLDNKDMSIGRTIKYI
jgi:hypothetical protein